MCDNPDGGNSRHSARKYEGDEKEPQPLACQDVDSINDEAVRMEDDGGGAQRSTPSLPTDSFRSPKPLIYFHEGAQQQRPPDSSTEDQTHTSIRRRMPPFIPPERPLNLARDGRPPERPRAPVMGHVKRMAYSKRFSGCAMPFWPERCLKDRMPMESTRGRPLFPSTPPAHAADRPQQQQQRHQPQPRARNADAGPEPEAGGAVDGAGAPRKEGGEEGDFAQARQRAMRVVQQYVGGGGQTRQQAMAGQGQQQTAAVHSQQPSNQVQHSHNHASSPAEGGRVGEVKGVVDPRVSSSEGEQDYH